jgi:hypothetical protein
LRVKFIRFLIAWLLVALIGAAVLVGVAFSPVVQAWAVPHVLGCDGGLQGGVDSVFAGPRSAEIGNLHLAGTRAVFTAPHVVVESSAWDLATRRTFVIKKLTAKGWTLDFTRRVPAPASASDATDAKTPADAADAGGREAGLRATVAKVADTLRDWVGSVRLPVAVSVAEVELEGDVLWPAAQDEPPIVIHVTINGGGLSAAHPGDFTYTATTADMRLAAITIKADGHLHVAMTTPKSFARLAGDAVITTGDQSNPAPWTVAAVVERTPSGADLHLEGKRGRRRLAGMDAHFNAIAQQWAGDWTVGLLAKDLAVWLPDHAQPVAGLKGQGGWSSDVAFRKINFHGRLGGSTIPRVAWLPAWAGPEEAVDFSAIFRAMTEPGAVRVDAARLVVTGRAGAEVRLTASQPFRLRTANGSIMVADGMTGTWGAELHAVPLAWAREWIDQRIFANGVLSGELSMRKTPDGWNMPAPATLRAEHVSLVRGNRVWLRDVDCVADVRIGQRAGLWRAEADRIEIGRSTGRLAVLSADLTQVAGSPRAYVIKGRGQADLKTDAWREIRPRAGSLPALKVAVDFAGKIAAESKIQGQLAVTGANAKHGVTGSYTLTGHADGAGELEMPLRFAVGGGATEFTAALQWHGDGNQPVELELTGGKIDLEPLRRLAAAAGVLPCVMTEETAGAVATVSRSADRAPFWSQAPQRINVQFSQVHAPGHDFVAVGGTLLCDATELRLEGGHAQLGLHTIEPIAAAITFDAGADQPYRLEASAAVTHIGAGWFFGFPGNGGHPQVEGHFDVKGSLTGRGANLVDLGARLRARFQLHGVNGITRLLHTDVAQVLPPADKPEKVKDSLVNMGSAVGALFGAKAAFDSGRIKLSPAREAVLNLDAILAEVGYDDFWVEGTRMPDGRIVLSSITLTAPEERLTGRGEIAPQPGRRLLERPFSADLQLAVKGGITGFFAKAKLLSARRDATGYTDLAKRCQWGGTLAAIVPTGWRQLLAEAALREDPAAGKKP